MKRMLAALLFVALICILLPAQTAKAQDGGGGGDPQPIDIIKVIRGMKGVIDAYNKNFKSNPEEPLKDYPGGFCEYTVILDETGSLLAKLLTGKGTLGGFKELGTGIPGERMFQKHVPGECPFLYPSLRAQPKTDNNTDTGTGKNEFSLVPVLATVFGVVLAFLAAYFAIFRRMPLGA